MGKVENENSKTERAYWNNEYKILPRNKLKSQLLVGTRDYYNLLDRFIVPGSRAFAVLLLVGLIFNWALALLVCKDLRLVAMRKLRWA